MKNNKRIISIIVMSYILSTSFNFIFYHVNDDAHLFTWTLMLVPIVVVIFHTESVYSFIWSILIAQLLQYAIEFYFNSSTFLDKLDFMLSMTFIDMFLAGVIYYLRLQQNKSIKKLEELALEDQLTGVYNRRYFDYYMPNILSITKMKRLKTQLFMIDIDNFKTLNDNHGHLFGDYVLREIANEIGHMIRDEDFFVRYGGEEFVLVLVDTSQESASVVADRILNRIESSIFLSKGERVPVTLSIGISEYNYEDTLNQFIAKADNALYEAKGRGKNQFILH